MPFRENVALVDSSPYSATNATDYIRTRVNFKTEAYRRKGERHRWSDLILASILTAPWPLSAHPFREVGTVGDLIDRGLPPDAWLGSLGVYAVVVPADSQIRVLDFPIVVEMQNVVVPLSADRLRAKWVPGKRVVFIGIAGNTNPRTLRQQLKDMINHAAGETTDRGPHRKGEALWQLEGYENFIVMAATTAEPPAPREFEVALLRQFQKRHGSPPFGNRGNAEPERVRTPPPVIVRDVFADAPPLAVKPTSAPLAVTVPTAPTSAKPDTIERPRASIENASMPSTPKPSVSKAIDSAFIRAHCTIVLEAMKAAPSETTLGELMQALKLHGLADAFLATSLGEQRGESMASRIAAIGNGHDDDDDDGEEPDEKSERSTAKAIPTKLNARTHTGHEVLDTDIEGVLEKAGQIPADESEKLLAAIATRTDPESRRNHVLFGTLAATGIRIGSALALDAADIDIDRAEIRLRKMKRGHLATVYVPAVWIGPLRAHLATVGPGPVFRARSDARLSQRQAQRRLEIWCERASLPRAYSPHAFRHAFAIRAYEKTRDIGLVQAAMAHRSIASTVVYARPTAGQVRAAVNG